MTRTEYLRTIGQHPSSFDRRNLHLIQGGLTNLVETSLTDKISEGMPLRTAERIFVLQLISKQLDELDAAPQTC